MNHSNKTYHIFFNNLANPLRIKIISALKENEASVNQLSKILKVEQSKLSHALANLRECNLVSFRQKGKERVYSLNSKTLLPILKIIDTHAKNYCKGECKMCAYS